MTTTQSALLLLTIYQGWSGEKVYTLDRAESVIADLQRLLMTCTSKKAACEWLRKEWWTESQGDALKLVAALWPHKAAVRVRYTKDTSGEGGLTT